MAFRDAEVVMYDGEIKISYVDKTHRYYKQERVDFALPDTDPKAWGKKEYPKGTTTLLGDTLEKKGLMTWPMGLALGELFGFYDFQPSDSETRLTGFSKGKGTLWALYDGVEEVRGDKEDLLPLVLSASKAWQRKQKSGADVGSETHRMIEEFIRWEAECRAKTA